MKPPDLELETDSAGPTGLETGNSGRGVGIAALPPLRFEASVPQTAQPCSPPVPSPLRQSGAAPVNVASASSRIRVTVDGKGFRLGPAKFHAKGVTYGPLAPGDEGTPFASPEATRRGFAQIGSRGANLLRV